MSLQHPRTMPCTPVRRSGPQSLGRLRRLGRRLGLGLGVALGAVPSAWGQAGVGTPPAPPPPPLPAALAGITTDTGDFAPRGATYPAYTTPALCVEAARTEEWKKRRTFAAFDLVDSLTRYAPERDTLPAAVAQVARACGARFPVAGTDSAVLRELFHLELLAGQDSLALAVMERLLALDRGTTKERAPDPNYPHAIVRGQSVGAGDLEEGIVALLDAEPARVAAAHALLAQLDKLPGRPTLRSRIYAHRAVMVFADYTGDTAAVRAEAETLLRLKEEIPVDSMFTHQIPPPIAWKYYDVWFVREAYWHLMWLDYLARQPWDSLLALARRAKADKYAGELLTDELSPKQARDYLLEKGSDALQTRLNGSRTEGNMYPNSNPSHYHIGETMPKLPAEYFFPAGAAAEVPGRVSLIVSWAAICYNSKVASADCWTSFFYWWEKWMREFGPKGLVITAVADVSRQKNNAILLHDPVTPDSAAKELDWFAREHWHLPVQVAVQVTPTEPPLPEPDGRFFIKDTTIHGIVNFYRVMQARPFEAWYWGCCDDEQKAVLLGRDGKIAWIGGWDPRHLEQAIALAVSTPPAAIPAGAPPPGARRPGSSSPAQRSGQ